MGILRVLLALAVILDHSGSLLGFKMLQGRIAVEAFFIISGFYMSLVLNEKYLNIENGYFKFISNRFLRLYPIYWIILLISMALSLMAGFVIHDFGRLDPYLKYSHDLSFAALSYLIVSNVIILGQDIACFLGLNNSGQISLLSGSKFPVFINFLIIPQAWTIALELMFYLIAPFIVRRRLYIIIIICFLSLTARIICYKYGYKHDPWNYRFFPFEIIHFLLGVISYRILKRVEKIKIPANLVNITTLYILIFAVFFRYIPGDQIKEMLFYSSLCIGIPFIFLKYKKSKLDRYIGEYSYTLYLGHIVIMSVASKIIKSINIPHSFLSLVTIILSTIFSALLIHFVSNKIEVIRAKRIAGLKRKHTPELTVT